MKIYTKSGDDGTTSLIGGERTEKYDLRVEAYGTVDELTAYIAYLADNLAQNDLTKDLAGELQLIESRLMSVQALLAMGSNAKTEITSIGEEHIADLEAIIDRYQEQINPLDKFTIPGGNPLVSLTHICRTVCRRAERCALLARAEFPGEKISTKYLNRLSDYLYTLGRLVTTRLGVEETLWIP